MKISQYFDTNRFLLKQTENSQKIHQKNLESIKNSRSRLIDCATPECYKTRKVTRLKSQIKDDIIYRENQYLLDRLLSMSEVRRKLKRINHQSTQSVRVKSMNLEKRKKIAKAISRENRVLAERIASSSPSFNINKMREDYLHHIQFRNMKQRFCGSEKSLKKTKIDRDLRFDSKNVELFKIPLIN